MRHRAFAAGIALVGIATVIACANIIGIEDLTRAPREAGPLDDASPMPDTSIDPCIQDPGPPQPASSTEGTSIAPFWVAANTMEFEAVDGLNLDNACTIDQKSSPCALTNFANSFQGDLPPSGYPRDIDNAGRELMKTQVASFPDGGSVRVSAALKLAVGLGLWTIGFRVSNYNGRADDPSITLQIAVLAAGGGQTWLAASESVDGGADTATASAKAWVAGGKLVAFFDAPLDFAVRLPPNPLMTFPVAALMSLHSAIVTADLVTDAGAPTLQNGIFGARWATSDAVAQIGSIDKGFACVILQSTFCTGTSDVLLERSQDHMGAGECNSLSGAFSFTTVPTNVTGVQTDAGALNSPTCKCP